MRTKKIVVAGIAALLVLTLVAPAAATPKGNKSPGSGPSDAGNVHAQGPSTEVAEAKAERLRQRIEQTLRNRKQRFDRAEERFATYVEKVQSLSGKVAAAGGDTSAAEAALARAEADLAEAAALEAQAVDQFRAAPGSDDFRAAYKEARETSNEAAAALRSGRRNMHEAVKLLRAELRVLGTTDGPEDES